jgi:AraC-like DNA-binding protein
MSIRPAPLPPLDRARVEALYAQPAIDVARERGADLDKLAAACGLSDLERRLDSAIPARSYIGLLHAASLQLDDPFFGLRVGLTMKITSCVGYGLAMFACSDIRSAMIQVIRFESLAHDLGRTSFYERDGIATLEWRTPWTGEPGAGQLLQMVTAMFHALAQLLIGMPLPRRESFYPLPDPGNGLREEILRQLNIDAVFDAVFAGGRFPSLIMDLPVASAEQALLPDMTRMLDQRLAARQREISEPPIVQAVYECISRQLKHDRTQAADVAKALGFSVRTLQRRLADADVKFSDVLDNVRREHLQGYLRENALSLTEIAFLLGYSDQSSFNRAFRDWFGTSPSAYRRQLGDAAGQGDKLFVTSQ